MYCYCKSEFSTSLFCIEDNCADEATPEESCCGNGICGNSGEGGDHNCSDCETETVIFDADYFPLTSKSEFPVPHDVVSAPALFKNFAPQTLTIFVFQDTGASIDYDSQELLPFLQTFLC